MSMQEQDHLGHLFLGWVQDTARTASQGWEPPSHTESAARVQNQLPGELGGVSNQGNLPYQDVGAVRAADRSMVTAPSRFFAQLVVFKA